VEFNGVSDGINIDDDNEEDDTDDTDDDDVGNVDTGINEDDGSILLNRGRLYDIPPAPLVILVTPVPLLRGVVRLDDAFNDRAIGRTIPNCFVYYYY
jgi:hypothetical protein